MQDGRLAATRATDAAPLSVTHLRGYATVLASYRDGLLRGWKTLLEHDATATQYQGPDWCVTWYDAYDGEYEPLVLAVHRGDALIALVPLCIERQNHHLHFAGLSFSDYRDVLAREADRPAALRALLDYYRDAGAPNVLRVGPMPPESQSAVILPTLLAEARVRGIPRAHFGWRYLAANATPETSPLKNKATKYKLNAYKRNGGTIDVEVIETTEQWAELRETFYAQHSLRQLSAGRQISFDDPRKRRLFDAMFHASTGHFSVLRANGRPIATHFGFRSGTMLHWGAPAFDIREAARSPSLLLVAMFTMDLARWGLTALDLTIGEGFLKERFSNARVTLPSVDLYPSWRAFAVETARTRLAASVKARPRVVRMAELVSERAEHLLDVVRRHGIARSAALGWRAVKHRMYERSTGLVLTVTPDALQKTAAPNTGHVRFGTDAFEDLLLWSGADVETAYVLRHAAQDIIANSKAGRTLHTLVVDGRLASLGYSYLPDGPATLTETGNLPLEFAPDCASLYAFFTLPEFRGRGLYKHLLSHILESRFQAGAKLAYITVLENNVASLRAIERTGFRRIQRNRVFRLFRWRRVERQSAPA
jgi:CelD/BcsL family acetyltransferase involved in cellulose biosynthesis/GNAT superfamily N-acetyltransferase